MTLAARPASTCQQKTQSGQKKFVLCPAKTGISFFPPHSGQCLKLVESAGPRESRLCVAILFRQISVVTLAKSIFAKGTDPKEASRAEQHNSPSMSSNSVSLGPDSSGLMTDGCIVAPFHIGTLLILAYSPLGEVG